MGTAAPCAQVCFATARTMIGATIADTIPASNLVLARKHRFLLSNTIIFESPRTLV
jgi:hypothetical protein